jgi:hypothetical protein
VSTRESLLGATRREEAKRQLDQQAAEDERREQLERDQERRRAGEEKERRERGARQRAYQWQGRLAQAHGQAEDAQLAFDSACAQLAAGALGEEEVERVQDERDRARRALERVELAARSLGVRS